jgi:hypothetical protein
MVVRCVRASMLTADRVRFTIDRGRFGIGCCFAVGSVEAFGWSRSGERFSLASVVT